MRKTTNPTMAPTKRKSSRPLTERQKDAIRRLARSENERCFLAPDLAKQLHNRKVAELTGRKHRRWEWRRYTGITWEVQLTAAGRNVLGVIGREST